MFDKLVGFVFDEQFCNRVCWVIVIAGYAFLATLAGITFWWWM